MGGIEGDLGFHQRLLMGRVQVKQKKGLLVIVGYCWLLLVVVGCCWLLLVVVGCCWLLLVLHFYLFYYYFFF